MCQRISTGTPTAVPSTELSGRGQRVDAGYMRAGLEEQDYSHHRESLVSDIPSGDGEIDNLFYVTEGNIMYLTDGC